MRLIAVCVQIADARRRRSRFGRKADGVSEGAEGRFMTQIGHSACSRALPEVDLQWLSMIVSI